MDDYANFRAPTVQAVMALFNNVAKAVITTCLGGRLGTTQDRALRVEHWIQVVKVCQGSLGAPLWSHFSVLRMEDSSLSLHAP